VLCLSLYTLFLLSFYLYSLLILNNLSVLLTILNFSFNVFIYYTEALSQHDTFSRWEVDSTSPKPQSYWANSCRLSATLYSIYSQLPSTLQAVPPTANWGRAVPWWQGPTVVLYGCTTWSLTLYSSPYLRAAICS
jgi:hypothetical protein